VTHGNIFSYNAHRYIPKLKQKFKFTKQNELYTLTDKGNLPPSWILSCRRTDWL